MSTLNRGLLVLGLLLLFTVAIRGQNVSEKYCKQFKRSVITKLRPTNIRTQDVNDNECVFKFSIEGNVDVSLDVEKLNSEEESHNSIDRFLELLAVGHGLESKADLRFAKLDTGDSWDEVYFVRINPTISTVLLLRKGKVRITVLSSKEEVLIQMGQLLRNKIERM